MAITHGTAARLFIVEFELTVLSGHFFNQALGFKLAAEERGMAPVVLLCRDAPQRLAEQLDAQRIIRFKQPDVDRLPYKLDVFAECDRQLRSLWSEFETMAISRDDIVLVTMGHPGTIYSVGAWLARIDPASRPAVFFRFYSHDYLKPGSLEYGDRSWLVRFASMDLSSKPGQDRVFFTANDQRLISLLGPLCQRHVFLMPLPMFYGQESERGAPTSGAPVIYIHLNVRGGPMLEGITAVIRRVMKEYPRTRVLLKYTFNALERIANRAVLGELSDLGVELIPAELSVEDYLQSIARSDIVVLPYDPARYAAVASGVFAEGAALGKVMVYPDATWMADQVAKGHAAGIGFSTANAAAISEAMIEAIRSLPQLSVAAQKCSASFRAHHSCRHNLDLMLALAGQSHDMSPAYVLGSTIRFNDYLQSRQYMTGGWSETEATGAWTNSETAELAFRVDAEQPGPLKIRVLLTPFAPRGHPLRVAACVNGRELCDWQFAEGDYAAVWRDLTIPVDLVADGRVGLLLRINDPLSPRQAGLSDDRRMLGVMFHEMSIDLESAD